MLGVHYNHGCSERGVLQQGYDVMDTSQQHVPSLSYEVDLVVIQRLENVPRGGRPLSNP